MIQALSRCTMLYLLLVCLFISGGCVCFAGADKPGAATPEYTVTAADVEARIERIMQERDGLVLDRLDAELVSIITDLHNRKKLKPILYEIGKRAQAAGKLPPRITSDNLDEFVNRLDDMIEAELQARGPVEGGKSLYRSWLDLSRDQLEKVRQASVRRAGPGTASAFKNPVFIAELEQLAETRFQPTEKVVALINGPSSFPLRQKLMNEAKKSIHVLTWAFEDDTTGETFSRLLMKRHKEGIDVKVIVDWKTAELPGYHKVLETMERAGVPVIRWQNPARRYYGLHRKIVIVDDGQAIAGGMNFGDVYSHMGEEKTPKWRDTDIYLAGGAARKADELFTKIWNEQVATRKLQFATFQLPNPTQSQDKGKEAAVAIIDHVPNPQGHDTIMLAMLKAIDGATTSIDIANAYYIQNPALEKALLDARARGVRVRLLTNSAESVDVPVISKPIVNSLPPLVERGVETYVKTGATLHSKVMVVDGIASFVMSYNLHPQSLRTQGEVAFLVLDENLAKELTAAYDKDIAAARKVTDPESVKMKAGPIDFIVMRYFFDQL